MQVLARELKTWRERTGHILTSIQYSQTILQCTWCLGLSIDGKVLESKFLTLACMRGYGRNPNLSPKLPKP